MWFRFLSFRNQHFKIYIAYFDTVHMEDEWVVFLIEQLTACGSGLQEPLEHGTLTKPAVI